jgi:hypothetical protein
MKDNPRLQKSIVVIETICARLDELRERINETHAVLSKEAVRRDETTSIVMADSWKVKEHYQALFDFIAFAKSMDDLNKDLQSSKNLEVAKVSFETLDRSLKLFNEDGKEIKA